MKKHLKKWGLSLLAVIVIAFGVLFSAGENEPSNILKSLPDRDLFGKEIKYDSKYYLVDAWATWCPPCVFSVPELSLFHKEYAKKGVMVLGLSVDRSPKEVMNFVEKKDLPYPVAMMSTEAQKALPKFRAIPTMFLLDDTGKVLWKHTGAATKAVLENELIEYLLELEEK